MKRVHSFVVVRTVMVLTVLFLTASGFAAEATYRNRDNPNPRDAGEGLYAIPYQKPARAEILEQFGKASSLPLGTAFFGLLSQVVFSTR